MAEYIEREATLKEVESRIMWGASAMAIYEAVQEAPTADVAPVRHGRWRWVGEDRWNDTYECSECGKLHIDNSPFCPNCGAKMDKEASHETGEHL